MFNEDSLKDIEKSRGAKLMASERPWHVPGKCFASPTYREEEVAARRDLRPKRVRFIDCTLAEGEDATDCHLGWAKRVEITRALDELGVGEITVPGGASYRNRRTLSAGARVIVSRPLSAPRALAPGFPCAPTGKSFISFILT